MGLPRTDLKLGQILKILNFEFCPRLKSVLHFPLLRALKKIFLYVKRFFEILKFVLGINLQPFSRTLNNNFLYLAKWDIFDQPQKITTT